MNDLRRKGMNVVISSEVNISTATKAVLLVMSEMISRSVHRRLKFADLRADAITSPLVFARGCVYRQAFDELPGFVIGDWRVLP